MAVPPINRDQTRSAHAPQAASEAGSQQRFPRLAMITALVVAIVTSESEVRGDPRLGAPGSENLPLERTSFLRYTNSPLFSLIFFVASVVVLGYYAVAPWRARSGYADAN